MKLPSLLATGLLLSSIAQAAFDPCKFNFGKGWSNGTNLSGVDFATIYAGDGGYNQYHHGDFLQETKDAGVTPMLYGYLTAFQAREKGGLKDCDVGEPSLCTGGSNYIRQHKAEILALYETYSQNVAAIHGKNANIIWLVEPDIYQYSVSGDNQRVTDMKKTGQTGGGIPDANIAAYFKEIAIAIRKHMPNAKIGVDISPWIKSPQAWYNNFDKSIIDYAFTSGGRTEAANTKIRTENNMTWAQAHTYTGKPILADCGYGVGGGKDGHHSEWDSETNIEARMNNGVISINQFDARSDWANSVLNSLRPKLPSLCSGTSSSSSVTPSSSSVKPSSSSIAPSSSSVNPSSSSNGGTGNPGYIRNGFFTQGTAEWTVVTKGSGSGTPNANNGVYVINGWGGSDERDVVIQQTDISVPQGSYVFSFLAGTQSGQTRPLGYLLTNNGQELCSGDASLTETMQSYSCNVTVNSQSSLLLEFLAGGAYWQEVRLSELKLINPSTPVRAPWLLPEQRISVEQSEGSIMVRGTVPGAQLGLYNLQGKSIRQAIATSETTRIQMQGLQKGVYILKHQGVSQMIQFR